MLCRTRVTSDVSYNRIDLDSTFDFLLFSSVFDVLGT
jgi:hypothetical protein